MKAKFFLMIILIGSVFISCLKPEKFPVEPSISFDSFTPLNDSGLLVISFTDGDGNIGLAEGDTTGPFSSTLKYHNNLFVEYFEKVDGIGWQQGKNFAGDDIVFAFRIPVLTPNGKNKALKGKINVTLEPSYYTPLSPDSDSIKYKITLVDRDFNVSNVVESNEIYR
jgi:hypothetical protein